MRTVSERRRVHQKLTFYMQ